jgi:DNA polymerase V
MEDKPRTYLCIDLKSFYASVECVERGLDPLAVNLVVADQSRTNKTICLAVSPPLKAQGVASRPRLFEVEQAVEQINRRRRKAYGRPLRGSSVVADQLAKDPSLALDYLVALPRMATYMDYSARIYAIYLKYLSKDDIQVYSIDEAFMDVTDYLLTYGLTAHDLAMTIVRDVLANTGITATAGIGTNLYLAKIAMDIVAKHLPADQDGVRIAELDEQSYRRLLWDHQPLSDFWRIGHGIQNRLARMGLYTMGDVARCSLEDEEKLYQEFGINAELLIDHAWGWEPVTMAEVKAYLPPRKSLSNGQVLPEPYPYEKGKLAVKEMADVLALDLTDKGLVTRCLGLSIGYDNRNDLEQYDGDIALDYHGKTMPKPVGAHLDLGRYTASSAQLVRAAARLYDSIVDKRLTVRRIFLTAEDVLPRGSEATRYTWRQFDLFADSDQQSEDASRLEQDEEEDLRLQKTLLQIKKRYGKNSVLKAMNAEEGGRTKERNEQIGGHRS